MAKVLRYLGGRVSLAKLLYFRYMPDGVRVRLAHSLRPLRKALGKSQAKLSVIVPVYNVEGYVRETLECLRGQQLTSMEIIVVDDGSTDDSMRIVEECRALDPRIVVLSQANAGLGAARNTGIRYATGEYLTFIDSDDIIPTGAYEYMVGTLDETGSDFSVGRVVRFDSRNYWLPDFSVKSHDYERLGTNIREFPNAMFDVLACNRVYRRDFWDREIGEFPEGMVYEDHAPSTDAYLRADAFDMLQFTTYDWRVREDQSSITQQNHLLENLKNRIRAGNEAQECIERFGDETVLTAWTGRVIAMAFTEYITFAIDGTDEYRQTVQEWIQQIYDLAPAAAFEYATPSQKTYSFFALRGEWEKAREIRADFTRLEHRPPTVIRDGELYADRAALESEVADELPDSFLRMSLFESQAELFVDRVRWEQDGSLVVDGFANVRFADSASDDLELAIALKDRSGAVNLQATLSREPSLRPDVIAGYTHAWHGSSYFTARWSAEELRSAVARGASLSLVADVSLGSLQRHADYAQWARGGSSAARVWRAPKGGLRAYQSAARGLLITRGRARREAEEMLQAEVGWVRRAVSTRFSRVESVEPSGRNVTVVFRSLLGRTRTMQARLRDKTGREVGQQRVTHLGGSRYELSIDFTDAEFGLAPTLAAPGFFTISAAAEAEPFRIARSLLDTLPYLVTTDAYEVSVTADDFREFALGLGVPHRSEFLAPPAVNELRKAIIERSDEVDRGHVLLQSYLGEVFTDSQLALARYLLQERKDLTLFAGVQHLGVRVPEGVTPLVILSPEWYEKLGRAEYLSHNLGFPGWFTPTKNQRFLQTFHGHPFKLMGKPFWEQKFADRPEVAERELELSRKAWTHLLISGPEADQMYYDAYPGVGEHIVQGLPRDDSLKLGSPANLAERSAQQIREGLGIGDAKFVVLYAPTWREQLATGGWSARTFLEFDPEQLAAALGEGAYVLVRGHGFNARQKDAEQTGERVIDVTRYPEINELVLASDAAVLDYSSLRFDYAVTGKPMVFFVPDEEDYFEGRPGLLPYRETTPGAIAKTEAELVAALRDVRQDPAPHPGLAEFNRRFNPFSDGHASKRVSAEFFRPPVD